MDEGQHGPGVIGPVHAGGLVIRAVVALVQHEGIKLPPLPRGVVHQSHVPLCDYKLPVGGQHNVPVLAELFGVQTCSDRCSPAVRGEADAADRCVEVEVMEGGPRDQAHQQCSAI